MSQPVKTTKAFSTALLAVLVIGAFIVPYILLDVWWKFLPSSLAIIGLFFCFRRDTWRKDLGLNVPRRDILFAAFAFLALVLATRMLIFRIADLNEIVADTSNLPAGWRFLPIFQVFNEEMLLRAVLLGLLAGLLRGRSITSLVAAVLFTLLHLVFYRFGSQQTLLPWTTFATLFLFSLASNELFLATRHIAFPYAIHLAWNLSKFGEQWMWSATRTPLGEAEGFAVIEGHFLIVIVASLLAVFALILGRRPARQSSPKRVDP